MIGEVGWWAGLTFETADVCLDRGSSRVPALNPIRTGSLNDNPVVTSKGANETVHGEVTAKRLLAIQILNWHKNLD